MSNSSSKRQKTEADTGDAAVPAAPAAAGEVPLQSPKASDSVSASPVGVALSGGSMQKQEETWSYEVNAELAIAAPGDAAASPPPKKPKLLETLEEKEGLCLPLDPLNTGVRYVLAGWDGQSMPDAMPNVRGEPVPPPHHQRLPGDPKLQALPTNSGVPQALEGPNRPNKKRPAPGSGSAAAAGRSTPPVPPVAPPADTLETATSPDTLNRLLWVLLNKWTPTEIEDVCRMGARGFQLCTKAGITNVQGMFMDLKEPILPIRNEAANTAATTTKVCPNQNLLFFTVRLADDQNALAASKAALNMRDREWDPKQVDANRQTALFYACKAGNLETAKWLVNDLGMDLAARDSNYQTCLFYAATSPSADLVRFLCEKRPPTADWKGPGRGKTIVDYADYIHQTALFYAVRHCKVDNVRALLEAGANPAHLDIYGRSALRHYLQKDDANTRAVLERAPNPLRNRGLKRYRVTDGNGETLDYERLVLLSRQQATLLQPLVWRPDYPMVLTPADHRKAIHRKQQQLQAATNGAKTRDDPKAEARDFLLTASRVVASFLRSKSSLLFRQPVSEAVVPGYLHFVKRPMDFGTIDKKLKRAKHLQLSDKAIDMRSDLWSGTCDRDRVEAAKYDFRRWLVDCEQVFVNCEYYNYYNAELLVECRKARAAFEEACNEESGKGKNVRVLKHKHFGNQDWSPSVSDGLYVYPQVAAAAGAATEDDTYLPLNNGH